MCGDQRPAGLLLRHLDPFPGDALKKGIDDETCPAFVEGVAAQLDDPALVVLGGGLGDVLQRPDEVGEGPFLDFVEDLLPVGAEVGGVAAGNRLDVELDELVDARPQFIG